MSGAFCIWGGSNPRAVVSPTRADGLRPVSRLGDERFQSGQDFVHCLRTNALPGCLKPASGNVD